MITIWFIAGGAVAIPGPLFFGGDEPEANGIGRGKETTPRGARQEDVIPGRCYSQSIEVVDFGWIGRICCRKIGRVSRKYGLLIAAALVGGCAAPVEPEGGGSAVAGAGEGVVAGRAQDQPVSGPVAGKPVPAVAAAAVGSIELEELFGLVESGEVLLLDVRPPLFHNLSHIPGSLGLPRKKFDEWIGVEEGRIRQAASAGRDVVLYCANRECPDASAVAGKLSTRGIPVRVFRGGWDEWKAAELPAE